MCRRCRFKTKSTVPPPAVDSSFFLRLTTIRKGKRPTPPSARGAETACIFRFLPRILHIQAGSACERVGESGGFSAGNGGFSVGVSA